MEQSVPIKPHQDEQVHLVELRADQLVAAVHEGDQLLLPVQYDTVELPANIDEQA